jgi:Fe-S-cluster-containing hydrogenase component 2
MASRKIVQIDEKKCNGCGLCVPSCAEGAIQLVDGKAKLVSDVYCDGLGACLGHCPQGAITVIQREADAFDDLAAQQHAAHLRSRPRRAHVPAGCPGAKVRNLALKTLPPRPMHPIAITTGGASDSPVSNLVNWPIQLHLVPPSAPFLRQAELLLVADCVPFAYADFHPQIVRGRPILIGCPKLDDAPFYIEKLAEIITTAEIRSLTVVHMEVPCCLGLVRIAAAAKRLAERDIPVEEVTISIHGQRLE